MRPAVTGMLPMARRSVLSGGAAAATLMAGGAPSALASLGRGEGAARAVFDSRVPQALAFGEQAAGRNIAAFGFAGDMSPLWFDTLLPSLRTDRGMLMGLTDAGALFCFERLAWDIGMRVRLRIDHRAGADGFSHAASVDVPNALRDRLDGAGPGFGAAAADAALDCRAAWGDCTHVPVPGAAGPAGQELVTWVIAPLGQP